MRAIRRSRSTVHTSRVPAVSQSATLARTSPGRSPGDSTSTTRSGARLGFPNLAPDLVVEVLSPGDRPGEVLAKVADWLTAGTRLVWTVDLERRMARIYRHDGSETFVTAEGALDGEDVLPGFSCPLVSIL